MTKFEPDKTGIITVVLMDGGLKKYTKTLNLKAFYIEFNEILIKKNFKDVLGTKKDIKSGNFFGGWVKDGEFVEQKINLSRSKNMFEKHFSWTKNGDVIDFELNWEAFYSSPITPHGWFYFKLDLVCRNLKNVELLDGNNKITLQSGAWEFRNKLEYKNSVLNTYLKKIPYIKNSPKLQNIYLHHIYEKILLDDLQFGENRIYSLLNDLIEKHFT